MVGGWGCGSRWCLCIKHADLRAHFFIDLDNSLSGYWCFLSSLTADFLVVVQAFASFGSLLLCCEQGKKLGNFEIWWSCKSLISFSQLALCAWDLDFVPFELLEIYS